MHIVCTNYNKYCVYNTVLCLQYVLYVQYDQVHDQKWFLISFLLLVENMRYLLQLTL